MERGEELMELNRAAFDRNEAAFKRNEAAFDRNTQAFERLMVSFDRFEKTTEEHQVFMRDMNRRNELFVQALLRDHHKFMEKLDAHDEEDKRKTDQILARLDDAREESKAHREALLALLDRLPPPAQAA
jgi:hypothetical protein